MDTSLDGAGLTPNDWHNPKPDENEYDLADMQNGYTPAA
jgi:hypothetical protein